MGPHFRALSNSLGIILLTMLLAGCDSIPWFGGEKDPTPPTELTEITQQVGLSELWSERATRGTDGRRLYLVPALAAGKLYLADTRGRVMAMAADSGREIWQRDTKYPFSGGPDVAGNELVLGTTQGDLIALSTKDGSELWRANLGSEVLSVPRLTSDGKVIVHTLNDSIYAFESRTGKELWRINYPAPVLTLRGSSTPLIMPNATIVGLSGGKLVKIDTNEGIPLWETIITRPRGRSELARISDLDADPILMGNTLYVGTYNGDLAAVDATTGDVLWRRELSAHAGLAADATGLYVTDSKDQVWSADITDGSGRWKQESLRYRRVTAPALIGNDIAVGDFDGYLHLLNKTDGRLVGRTRIAKKAGITARPLVQGNRIYVYAEDGTISALTLGAQAAAKSTLGFGSKQQPAPKSPQGTATESVR
ncbi:outer membrane protein assembly factor BamB [Thiorhodococcus mannitoliphagus]|uniref:Outer membrane protein assembly factor BamB n=1 Tax=Thiorhodococcus mannitoliphagus TaxID=329406 RepID=A0A6P1DV65_9GAMM|nr:outer membrane protein assembly factor BamB [Thiorhodococcus mannitoliphagus]NEX19594.1 outer membrane protein assembly factor BamB [Thiorhodococcus mannitoliphagus]